MHKQTRASAKALKLSLFLRSIIESPPALEDCEEFAKQLSSQGAMASFTSKELDMKPISLNALKAASSECFDEGFQHLDALRLRAVAYLRQRLSTVRSTGKRNKDSLKREITDLVAHKQRLEGNLMILTQALRLSIGLCEKYVRLTNNHEYKEAFNLERLELLEMLLYSEKR